MFLPAGSLPRGRFLIISIVLFVSLIISFNEYPQTASVGAYRIRPNAPTYPCGTFRAYTIRPYNQFGKMRTFRFLFICRKLKRCHRYREYFLYVDYHVTQRPCQPLNSNSLLKKIKCTYALVLNVYIHLYNL